MDLRASIRLNFAQKLIINESAFHPEDKARSLIDRRLAACGWLIQSKSEMNPGAGLGVAVREFQTASGPVDYGLFVGRKLCGVIEAKAEGAALSGYSEQAARYLADVPKHLVRKAPAAEIIQHIGARPQASLKELAQQNGLPV